MRPAFALVLAAASLFASVRAVPSTSNKAIGTIVKVWLNGVTESKVSADEYFGTVQKRQTLNLIGATCESTCSGTAGLGPNQNDCDTILSALLADGTAQFTVATEGVFGMTFGSCAITFVNFTTDTVVYQENDWGSVAQFLTSACNAANGFSEGQCTFDDAPNVFIRVLHS